MQAIAPGLADYTDNTLFGDVWARPDLSPRDRSLVTLSALIATGKAAQLPNHLRRGLDNGLKPGEIAAMVTHLAFYTGWPNAVSALDAIEPAFAERKVDMATLRAPAPAPSPVSSSATAEARSVDTTIGPFAPKLAQLTKDVLLDDLWQRGDLTPRDRRLVTIIAYAATGDAAQLPAHLRRGIENGLTRPQIAEALTHLAFYAGWPKAVAAVRAFGETITDETPTGRLEIHRPGTDPRAGPADTFTGSVTVASAFKGSGGAALGGATVAFGRSARSNWHTHPLGQLLVVTSGRGWVQAEGQPVRVMSAGDVVWTPPRASGTGMVQPATAT